jgi:predicted anti-sigma-YlaC factor YlaD
VRCAEAREMLPAYLQGGEGSLAVRRHLSGCPGCRAELRRYEALAGGLSRMRSVAAEPPPSLKPALLAIPRSENRVEAVRTHIARNRRTYAGAAAVAIAGAAGALAWQSRRRLAPA